MSYPKQVSVADRLQTEAMDELHGMKDKNWKHIERLWRLLRTDLRGFILDTYSTYFPEERWSLVGLWTTGAIHTLMHGIQNRVNAFTTASWSVAKNSVNDIYKQSVLRHAWVLDETTPPNVIIRIPHKLKLLESSRLLREAAYFQGAEAVKQMGERWNAWTDGYQKALLTNLQMGAMNASSASDAAAEVDATRVNTPSSGLLDALQSVFDFEVNASMNNAISSVSQVNEQADVEQIWETRRNAGVCDDCDANEGLTEEETDGDIPMHPNCRCYWRIVPASWAKLLRSGDEDDYQTAVKMDSAGLVPTAMTIKDAEGNLAGYTMVDFSSWQENNMHVLSGQ